MTNSTSNQVLENEQVNGTHTIYSIPAVAGTCQPLSFNVTATTSGGTSVPAVVEGGFPIGEFTYCEWHYDSLNSFPLNDTIWCHHGKFTILGALLQYMISVSFSFFSWAVKS